MTAKRRRSGSTAAGRTVDQLAADVSAFVLAGEHPLARVAQLAVGVAQGVLSAQEGSDYVRALVADARDERGRLMVAASMTPVAAGALSFAAQQLLEAVGGRPGGDALHTLAELLVGVADELLTAPPRSD